MEGILEEGEDFTEFRTRVVELIKDVVFIVGSSNVFKHMLAHLVRKDHDPVMILIWPILVNFYFIFIFIEVQIEN